MKIDDHLADLQQRTAASVPTPTASIVTLFVDSSNGHYSQKDSAGVVTDLAAGGGSGSPGGATTQVQYNNAGAFAGNAGFTFDPASGLTIGTALVLSGDITPAQLTADQNDYNPAGLATACTLRLSSDNDLRQVNGISGGTDGRILTLVNVGVFDITLAKEISTSTAANRFNAESLLVANGGTAVLQYDGTTQRWMSLSTTGDDGGALGNRRMPFLFSDFLGIAAATSVLPFVGSAFSTGTIAIVNATLTREHQGIVRLTSSTTTNSGYALITANNCMKIAGGEVFEAVIMPQTIAATTIRVGFHNATNATDATNGAFFEIISGVVTAKNANASTRTTSANLTTLVTATWYRFRIEVARDFSTATYTIYNSTGGVIATVSQGTNLPAAAGNAHGAGLVASSTNVAATAIVDVDYMGFGFGQIRPLLR